MSNNGGVGERSTWLDLLRIFAAFWVLAFHLSGHGGNYPQLISKYDVSWIPEKLNFLFSAGFLGVDIFFILSGIVIAQTAIRSKSSADFLKNRFLRLFPAYFLITVVSIIFVPFSLESSAPRWSYFVSITGLQFWSGQPTLVGTTWTLPFEALFYVFVALTIFFYRKYVNSQSGLYFTAIALTVLSVLTPAIKSQALSLLSLSPYGTYFALGMSIFGIKNLKNKGGWKLLLLLNLTLSLDLMANRLGGNLLISYAAATLLLALITTISFLPSGKVFKDLRVNSAIGKLALMTYPTYLLHEFLGMAMIVWLVGQGIATPLASTIAIFAITLASWLLVEFVEPKSRTLIRKYFNWK